MPPEAWADLHVHTRWSDGTQDLPQLAERARRLGLAAVAVTDHDTVGADFTAPTLNLQGIEVICGVEVKAWVGKLKGEILGYFLRPGHPALEELFSWLQAARQERMRAMVDKCRALVGKPIALEEVQALAAGSLGRPHLAALLVRHGLASGFDDAFRRFLEEGAPCYVPLPRPTTRQAIAAIRAAGGVAALAHPAFLAVADWEKTLAQLAEEGLAAVEVHYPYESSRQPLRSNPAEVAAAVHKLGLIPTGGSDDHGPGSVKESLGAVKIPYELVDRLRSATT